MKKNTLIGICLSTIGLVACYATEQIDGKPQGSNTSTRPVEILDYASERSTHESGDTARPQHSEIDGSPTIGTATQSECLPEVRTNDGAESGDDIELLVDGNSLTIIDHNAVYNCCADVWFDVTVDGNTITAVEVEDPDLAEACNCVCRFDISVTISDLASGDYTVSVYGKDATTEQLMHQESIVIGEACARGDIVYHTCPDGSDIVACECDESGQLQCIDSPENLCGEATVTIGESSQSECLDTEINNSGPNPASSSEESSVELIVEGDTLTVFDHHGVYNCCADVWFDVTVDGNTITAVEVEDPDLAEACNCVCPYELSVSITHLAVGDYSVRVYRQVVDPATLLLDGQITIVSQ